VRDRRKRKKMTELYVSLNGKVIDKERKEANLRAQKAEGEDETNDLLWPEVEATVQSFEVKEGILSINFDSELGYFSFHYNVDKDDRIEMLEDSIRLINKFKAAIEALK
jgi:hypothetical protein